MKRLLFSSVLSAGIKVGSAGLTFLMFMFLARTLGATQYGLFGTMFALGTVAAVTAAFGQHILSLKVLSALGDSPSDGALRRGIIRRSYLVVCIAAVGCIGLMLIFNSLYSRLGPGFGGDYLLGASALVLPFALAELVSHHYRSLGSLGWSLFPRDILWRAVIVILCLGAAIWPSLFVDAVSMMLTISFILLLIVLIQVFAFFKQFKHQLQGDDNKPALPGEMSWRASIWMWIASLGTMGGNLNVVAAAAFLPADQVGAYFAAQKISQLLQLPLLAVNLVAAPLFARLSSQKDQAGLQDIARKLVLITAAPLAVGTLLIGAFAHEFLRLFDPTFVLAVYALMILAASQLIMGLGGPTRQLMLMAGGERDFVRITAISEAIGLAMMPLLVPLFGILGAALAAMLARTLLTIMSVLWCKSRLGTDTSVFSLLPKSKP